jgi:hypothetical protein
MYPYPYFLKDSKDNYNKQLNLRTVDQNDYFLNVLKYLSSIFLARHWWFTLVILATQEAKIRRMWFKASLSKQFETLSQKTLHKKGLAE